VYEIVENNPFAPELEIRAVDDIRIVVLNRPEARNAVDEALHGALAKVWGWLAQDETARAVVLTANGKAFCSGGDFNLMQELHADRAKRTKLLDEGRVIIEELLNCPLPVVTAVNGPAAGLGASLAVLSDMVFMSEDAFMSDPHVAVGLTAGDGGPLTWPFLTSLLRAKEFLFTGDRIPADQAVALGLANRVVAADALQDEALAFARRLAALPRHALRSSKRAINLHVLKAAGGLLDFAFAMEHQSFDDEDHRRIVSSILAKSS
jgi:enoyl-CoA hydratase